MADEDLEVAVEADDAPNDDEMVRCVTEDKDKLIVKEDVYLTSVRVFSVLPLFTRNSVE